MVALEHFEAPGLYSQPKAQVRDSGGRVLALIDDRTDLDDPLVRAAVERELPSIVELVRFAAKHLVGLPASSDPLLNQRLQLVRSYGIHCLEAVERIDRRAEPFGRDR